MGWPMPPSTLRISSWLGFPHKVAQYTRASFCANPGVTADKISVLNTAGVHRRYHPALVTAAWMLAASGCRLPDDPSSVDRARDPLQTRCGEERWAVKTGTDRDAFLVSLQAEDAQLSELVAFPRPAALPHTRRVGRHETQVYRLSGVTLVKYKRESDGDYHLVLSDGFQTMIAEIPQFDCVGSSSPFAPGIRNARARFDSRFDPIDRFQYARIPVAQEGVGFFDFLHDQTGVAPNGFELHPVLDLCFGSNCRLSSSDSTADTLTPPNPLGCGCASSGGPTVALGLLLLLGWFRYGRAGKSFPARRTAE